MQAGLIEWAMTTSFARYPAGTAIDQSAYRVVADFLYAYIYRVESPFLAIMLGVGTLVISWAMRNSAFGRMSTYVGFVTGAIAIMGGITGFFPLLLSLSIWSLLVGMKLFRLRDVVAQSEHISQANLSTSK